MLISRAAVAAYLEREMDDWRWMKKVQRSDIEDVVRSLRPRPHFVTRSWIHQLVCFYLAMTHPRFLFLLDMGLGKTKIMLDVMHQRIRAGETRRWLVLVPNVLNIDTWLTAAGEHSVLDPSGCTDSEIGAKWERLMDARGDMTIIDYQGLTLALTHKRKLKVKPKKSSDAKDKNELVRDDKKVRQMLQLYDGLVLDESHKLRNKESLWHGLVWQLSKELEFCYALTGTFFDRDLEEVWSQYRLVDLGGTFGEHLGLMRAAFYDSSIGEWGKVEWNFRKDRSRTASRFIRHRSIRYDESEVQELPPRVLRRISMKMGVDQEQAYLQALQGVVNAGGKLRDLETPWIRLRQATAGYMHWSDDYGEHHIEFVDSPKLAHLLALVDSVGAEKVVVAYTYTETAAMIARALTKAKVEHAWIYGGTKDKPAELHRFIGKPTCRVLLLNSAAGGTGIDGLQNVCRTLVFYETPTTPSLRQQTLKRIHRPGSERRVFIWDLVCTHTVDKRIVDDVIAGRDFYERLMAGGWGAQDLQ